MPILFGPSITNVTYNTSTFALVCTGSAFGEEIDPISNIHVSASGLNDWNGVIYPPDYWSDTIVSGNMSYLLLPNWYDVRVTSSDGEYAYLSGAFSVGSVPFPSFKIDINNVWNFINQTYVLVSGTWIKPSVTFSVYNGEWRYHY